MPVSKDESIPLSAVCFPSGSDGYLVARLKKVCWAFFGCFLKRNYRFSLVNRAHGVRYRCQMVSDPVLRQVDKAASHTRLPLPEQWDCEK